jgi:hypothetical protein
MTLADYSLAAFTLLNGGRAVAYFPQLLRVYRDPHGATAVSLTTWVLFAAANVATIVYALAVADDCLVAAIFALNAVGCLAIVVLTAMKRAGRTPWATPEWIVALRQSIGLGVGADALKPKIKHGHDGSLQGWISNS